MTNSLTGDTLWVPGDGTDTQCPGSLKDQTIHYKVKFTENHTIFIVSDASLIFNNLAGQCTNFGLKEAIALKWKKLQELERQGDYATSYAITYR